MTDGILQIYVDSSHISTLSLKVQFFYNSHEFVSHAT
jgi:hypothetical protein